MAFPQVTGKADPGWAARVQPDEEENRSKSFAFIF